MELITYKHLLSEYKDEILKQLEALVKVSKRVGVPAPTWKFGEEYEYEFTALMAKGHDEDEYETFIEKVFDIEISLEQSIKMEGGWKLAAFMIHETGSMFQIDVDVEIPARFNPKVAVCEHCGRAYARVKSFLIVSEAGEWKQIGKSCLKQFLGINPTSYISMFEAISKFSNYIESVGYAKNRGGRMENLAYNVEDMLRYTIGQVGRDGQFVKAEWTEVETGKYTWRGDAIMKNVRTNEPNATIDKVRKIIAANSLFKFNPAKLVEAEALTADVKVYETLMNELDAAQKMLNEAFQGLVEFYTPAPQIGQDRDAILKNVYLQPDVVAAKNASNEAYAAYVEAREIFELKTAHNWYLTGLNDLTSYSDTVAKVYAWAEAIVVRLRKEWTEDGEVEVAASGFEQFRGAVKDTFSKKRVLQTNLKYVCTGYSTFMKDMAYAVENADKLAKKAISQHVGVVGEKVQLVLKVTGHKSGIGTYGTWNLWTLEDAQGNQFKKFGVLDEKFVIERPEGLEGLVGCTMEALFEIKSHDTFDNEKQTALGRLSKVKPTKKAKA